MHWERKRIIQILIVVVVLCVFFSLLSILTHKYVYLNGKWYNTDITELELINCSDKSINKLKYFTSLKKLTIDGEKTIDNIDFLLEMKDIEELNLGDFNVNDWSGLLNCKKLKCFYGFNTNIEDLSVLSMLPNLESLTLQYTNITNISGIEKLQKLNYLFLSCDISDLTGLESCSELKNLYLFDKQVPNMEVLRYLNKLESLYVGINSSQSVYMELNSISYLSNLTNLSLINIDVSTCDALLNCDNLQEITLSKGVVSTNVVTELEKRGISVNLY